jgi:hypothetical protein
MTRRRTARRTTAASEIDNNQEVETPKEVEQLTEQEQMIVPTPKPGSEEPSTSTDKEVKRSIEQKQPFVTTQKEVGIGSDTSVITEQLTPEIEASKESRSYSSGFGWVVIDGIRFENDVVVQMDGSIVKRDKSLSRDKKAKYGHTPLTSKELLPLLEGKPDLIVIGTGHNGAMPITPKAQKILSDNISFIGPTPEALEWMQKDGRKAVALLHITC